MMLWNTRTVCNAIDVSEQAMRSKRQSLDKTKQQQKNTPRVESRARASVRSHSPNRQAVADILINLCQGRRIEIIYT